MANANSEWIVQVLYEFICIRVLTFLQLLGYVIHDHFPKLKLQGGAMAHWLAQLSCNLLVPVRG